MQTNEDQPARTELLAAYIVNLLQRLGLSKLAYSSIFRNIGKTLLLRDSNDPKIRVIASGLGKGLKILASSETPKSYWLGTHEPKTQEIFRHYVKPGMVIYDCGANVGYFSTMLAHLVGNTGHVFAFEPSPFGIKSLQSACDLNSLVNLTTVPQALWSQKETLSFACGATDGALANDHVQGIFGDSALEKNCIQVSATSLDEFVYSEENPPPAFIKIDVEGAEGRTVEGAKRLLAEHRPVLFLEIHGSPGREVWYLLKDLNYTFRNIVTGKSPQTVEEFAIWIRQFLAIPSERKP